MEVRRSRMNAINVINSSAVKGRWMFTPEFIPARNHTLVMSVANDSGTSVTFGNTRYGILERNDFLVICAINSSPPDNVLNFIVEFIPEKNHSNAVNVASVLLLPAVYNPTRGHTQGKDLSFMNCVINLSHIEVFWIDMYEYFILKINSSIAQFVRKDTSTNRLSEFTCDPIPVRNRMFAQYVNNNSPLP